MKVHAPNRYSDGLSIVLPGLVAFAVYLVTLAPTVTGEDAGEFILAAWSLGIPHPPGYPLWTLLSHPFTWLPWGDVAFRVNLASATFAALTISLLTALALRLTGDRIAAIGAALAFAFSRSFWEQSLIAEVYTLNALCFALCLYFLLRWEEGHENRWLWALALCFGLSLGAHNTMMLAGPVLAAYVFLRDPRRIAHLPRYGLLTLTAIVAALLIYLYLPLRAAAGPIMNWGDPSTWDRFWDVVQRKQYAHMFTEGPRGPGRFVQQLAYMGRLWLTEFTVPVGLVCLAGFGLLLRRHRAFALLTLLLSFVIVAGLSYIQNFEFDREWLWVMTVFGIPAYLLASLWLAALLARLQVRPVLQIICAVLVVIAGLWQHGPVNNKSAYYWAADYAENLLSPLPEQSILALHQDHANFPALYRQAVEGLRPDVIILRKYGYFDLAQIEDMPEAVRANFSFAPSVQEEPEILRWILEETDRPLFVSRVGDRPAGPYRIVPAGLIHQILRPGEAPALDTPMKDYGWRGPDPRIPHPDYTVTLIGYELHRAEAEHWFHAGDMARGLEKVDDAIAHFGEDPVVLNSLGVLVARHGQYDKARALFQRALAQRPHFEGAARNLARTEERLDSDAQKAGDDPVSQAIR